MDINELVQILPKHVIDWTVEDVQIWLNYISLPHFAPAAERNHIEGYRLFLMTQSEIACLLGVQSKIQLKKLVNWINYLTDNLRLMRALVNSIEWEQQTQLSSDSDLEQYFSQNTNSNSHLYSCGTQTQDKANLHFPRRQSSGQTQKMSYPQHHLSLFLYPQYSPFDVYTCARTHNLNIGKGEFNDIKILEQSVEVKHCSIVHMKGGHYIVPEEDAASGVWVKIKQRFQIDKPYIIQMGLVHFIVSSEGPLLILKVIQELGPEQLFIYDPIDFQTIRVGRATKNQLCFVYDTTMSNLHGKFNYVNGFWYFEDMCTTNSSWYRCEKEQLITDKMSIRIGRSIHVFDCRLKDSEDVASISSVRSTGMCKQCRKVERNSYFSPCNHSNSCINCAIQTKKCMQCNQPVVQTYKMYRQ